MEDSWLDREGGRITWDNALAGRLEDPDAFAGVK